jgi:O-antigen ligase
MASAHHAIRVGPAALAGLLGLGFLALFSGLVSALLPAWLIFAALLVPAVAVLVLVRPEYALLACMALVCGLIHPAFVPRIPVLGGALAAADATLAMLALYAAWSTTTRAREAAALPVAGARSLAAALGLFGLTFAVAVTTSLTVQDLNPAFVLGEARDLLYLLILPIALVILRPHERQERFVIGLVVLGCLFSVGQVLQGVFNIPVFGDQGISALETLGRQEDSTTRANTLGLNIIIFALFLTVGAYVLGRIRKPLFLTVAGLLFVGIVLTFGRTTFAAVLICTLLLVWWLNARKVPQLAMVLLIAVGLGSAAAAYWKPDSFAAVYYRLTSIGEELDHGYSAQWRLWEAEAMLPHIKEHPLIGVGLGADYKGSRGSTLRPDLNRYVHNAYLYMAGKMGLPALIFFLLVMASVFNIGRRSARSHALPWTRIVGAASAAMMIRFLFASVTEPHLMSDYGVVNIAIAAALVYLSAQRSGAVVSPAVTSALAAGARHRRPARVQDSGRTP